MRHVSLQRFSFQHAGLRNFFTFYDSMGKFFLACEGEIHGSNIPHKDDETRGGGRWELGFRKRPRGKRFFRRGIPVIQNLWSLCGGHYEEGSTGDCGELRTLMKTFFVDDALSGKYFWLNDVDTVHDAGDCIMHRHLRTWEDRRTS